MWSPVILLLLVASVRAEAEADPEPFLSLLQPQFATTWAAQQFGTPGEIAAAGAFATQRFDATDTNFGFSPAKAPPSPLFAIRDVQVPTKTFADHRLPSVTPDFLVLRQPSFFLAPPVPQPFFLQTVHLRVPHTTRQDIPVPVTAPESLSFASQHTTQIPFSPSFLGLLPLPIASPSYSFATRQASQVPDISIRDFQDDDEDDDVEQPYIILPHFPTELAPLKTLRDMNTEPVIPAGIVQSTQPSFSKVVFTNDKAHPSLLNKKPADDGAVLAI